MRNEKRQMRTTQSRIKIWLSFPFPTCYSLCDFWFYIVTFSTLIILNKFRHSLISYIKRTHNILRMNVFPFLSDKMARKKHHSKTQHIQRQFRNERNQTTFNLFYFSQSCWFSWMFGIFKYPETRTSYIEKSFCYVTW